MAAIVISDPNPVLNYPRTAWLRSGGVWVQGPDGFADILGRIGAAEAVVASLDAAMPAKLGRSEITAATPILEGAPGQYVVVWDTNDAAFKLIDITAIGDDMAQVHWFDASDSFGISRAVLVQDDGTLRRIRIQNNSDTANIRDRVGRHTGGHFKAAGSITLGPGAILSRGRGAGGQRHDRRRRPRVCL